jgi:hypothetical protein
MIGGSSPGRGWEFFFSPPRSDRFWGPPSLLSNGYQGFFPWGQSGRVVKLTTQFHLAPGSRMPGAIPPLPSTTSWRGAQLKKHRDNFTFNFTFRFGSISNVRSPLGLEQTSVSGRSGQPLCALHLPCWVRKYLENDKQDGTDQGLLHAREAHWV